VIDGFATSELDEIEQAYYAFNFYPDLMTVLEMEAYHHLLAICEFARGLNFYCQPVDKAGSEDPAVLFLARDGWEAFKLRTGKRILKDHRDQVVLNCCSRCGELARTPKAQQCRYCGNDWHEGARR
jgi:hypothetical protein